ncbi:MAG: pantetheine-phosphate adenylyltransferase [Gemmatimonadetes bacterium]|nr:pantetheine-phosphate adenylyltransferase [Gemmatimonadota bacterium]NNM03929.1 pantetheine-phosphate adenylyltransferase [Gemmatimonadota bacterium]
MTSSRKKVLAVYPGSFDPVTLGHEDIARRTLRLADRLLLAVAETATHSKSHMFSVEERVDLLREVYRDDERVECVSFSGLLMDFARDSGAHCIIRGLRAVSDFEYEMQMAQMNRELWPEVETVFLTPDAPLSFLSASLVREVATLGGDVSSFVSPLVMNAMKEKLLA